MYAIRSKLTGQWLYGTDYREYPYIQRLSNRQAMIFETLEEAEFEFERRECNEEFGIVEVKLLDMKEYVDLASNQIWGWIYD